VAHRSTTLWRDTTTPGRMKAIGAGRPVRRLPLACVVAALALVLTACSTSGAPKAGATTTSTASSTTSVASSPGITSVQVQVVQTADGQVGYRTLGRGTPLVLLMGLGGSVDDWDPTFVDALAARYRVIAPDNADVGQTAAVPPPLTVTAMAQQVSAFVSALGLSQVDVLGWSMGGMIAQALAVLHPGQVRRLVLAATQPGTGTALPVPTAAAADAVSANPADVLSVLFPPAQAAAEQRYVHGIVGYPGYYAVPRSVIPSQSDAVQGWLQGDDPSGRRDRDIRAPTLVADGTTDALDPVANDRMLATTITRAELALYPGAGHGFLFQDAGVFVARLEAFLR